MVRQAEAKKKAMSCKQKLDTIIVVALIGPPYVALYPLFWGWLKYERWRDARR